MPLQIPTPLLLRLLARLAAAAWLAWGLTWGLTWGLVGTAAAQAPAANTSSAPTDARTNSTTSTSTDSTATARTVVRVGLYHNPPKLMADTAGQPTGILGDLLREIAKAQNWTLVPVPCDWEACLAGLNEGRIDLMPDVARTDSRARLFDFHEVPSLHSWSQLYRRSDLVVESMLDLQNKSVAVLEGSVQQEYLRTLLAGFGLNTRFVTAPNFEAAFAMVARGEADVVASNHHFGDWAANRLGLAETPLMFLPSRLFYATGKDRNPALLAGIDRELAAWQAVPGSTYYATLKRWGVTHERGRVPLAFWWGLGVAVAALLLALGFVALMRREVQRRTRALQASEDKLATILNSVDAAIYIKDMQLRYQYANRQVCEVFGRPLSEVVGQGDEAFFDADTVAHLRQVDQQVLEGGERLLEEERNRTHSGEERIYISVKMPLRDARGHTYALCGISTDITEQRQFAQEIHQLAYYDPLTHLPNRKQMLERLQALLGDGSAALQPHALLLIDLDHFKDLNDVHGHQKGDRVLVQVAERISQCARSTDLVARLGADEFALLMTGLPSAAGDAQRPLELAAAKVLEAVTGMPYQIEGSALRVNASLGATVLVPSTSSVDEVLKQADIALFQAKAAGSGSVRFFRADMAEMLAARASLEADLREGLALQQFLLHYQPQVDESGLMVGVEALVRWRHPQRGLVSPAQFIALAEVSGLIEPLGRWILQTACQQLSDWQRDPARAHLVMAVNISAKQIHHPDFVHEVEQALAHSGAPPQLLELELTESLLVEDISGATAKMQALKARGVRFSLDDFGTGYSSLSYLKRLPLDQLKIDQGFVRDLLLDANDLSIVKAIVDMGRNLQLEVLAEGVETAAQRDMLRQAGCLRYQGYLFGRPVPAAELPRTRLPAPDPNIEPHTAPATEPATKPRIDPATT